jgi:hypothetical protein
LDIDFTSPYSGEYAVIEGKEAALDSFTEEFGFLPPGLVFTCHEFIKAYHDHRGSGWPFLKPQLLRANRSPYLGSTERVCLRQFRHLKIALALGAIALAAAVAFSYWLLLITAGSAIVVYKMSSNIKFNLIQIRSLILSNEMLAADFAGWGSDFPTAKARAVEWLARCEPDEKRLLDVYMPLDEREKWEENFRPSEASLAAAKMI